MNIFADFDARIKKTLQEIDLKTKDGSELDLSRISVEPPRDASHGDIATNAAMVLSKAVGQNPRELATAIADALKADADVASVDVAGPGFINLRLKDVYWQRELSAMLNEATDFGRSKLGAGKKSTLNMFRQTRLDQCMLAIAVVRLLATYLQTC